jgi:hypothetical protein
MHLMYQIMKKPFFFSKSSSKGAMYVRMTDIAERKGGARRGWTKGVMPASGAREDF